MSGKSRIALKRIHSRKKVILCNHWWLNHCHKYVVENYDVIVFALEVPLQITSGTG